MKLYKAKNTELEKWVIIGSGVVSIGDPVKIDAASVDAADAVTDLMYGLCVGIVDKFGVPLEVATAANFSDGSYDTSLLQYTAAADNATDKMVCALVHPFDGTEVLTALLDGTINATTGSGKPGYYIDVNATYSTTLDEDHTHATNVLQFVTVDNGTGLNSCQDPVLKGNNILVKPREVQVPGAQG